MSDAKRTQVDGEARLYDAVTAGRIEEVNAVFDDARAVITRDAARAAFCMACAAGDVEIVHTIYRRAGLGKDDVRANDNEALRRACACGRTDVILCLFVVYKLTHEDACANDNEAFLLACASGKPDAVRRLVTSFQLTVQDICANDGEALKMASTLGRTKVVVYLLKNGAKLKHVRANNYAVLMRACEEGCEKVVRAIVGYVGLGREELLSSGAFARLCEHGHVNIIAYLVRLFYLSRRDIAVTVYGAAGTNTIARYLQTVFGADVIDDEATQSGVVRISCTVA